MVRYQQPPSISSQVIAKERIRPVGDFVWLGSTLHTFNTAG